MPVRFQMFVLVALVAAGACSVRIPGKGARLFRSNCAGCHGADGAGDGPLAASLPVPPSNLRTLSADNGGVFPAERVMATIYGYAGKDDQALMPEFGPILDSPPVGWTAPDGRVIPTPSALVALVEHVETLQDP